MANDKLKELSQEIQLELQLFQQDQPISDELSSLLTGLSQALQLANDAQIVDLKALEPEQLDLWQSDQSEQLNPEDQVIRWTRTLFP